MIAKTTIKLKALKIIAEEKIKFQTVEAVASHPPEFKIAYTIKIPNTMIYLIITPMAMSLESAGLIAPTDWLIHTHVITTVSISMNKSCVEKLSKVAATTSIGPKNKFIEYLET